MNITHSSPTFLAEMVDDVTKALLENQHTTGLIRRKFEGAISEYLNMKNAIAVNSGSAALHALLLGLHVKRGDTIVIPSYTCAAVLNAVKYMASKVIVTDVDAHHFNMTEEAVVQALKVNGLKEDEIRYLIVTHSFGCPAPVNTWDLNIPFIEDCSLALGSRIGKACAGTFGVGCTLSFYATKMISTGQGGMILTQDDAMAWEIRDIIQYDKRTEWKLAWNYMLSDINASIGMAQISHLNEFIEKRRSIATSYRALCDEYGIEYQRPQDSISLVSHNYFRFILLLDKRRKRYVQEFLNDMGISSESPVFKPIHRYLGLNPKHYPQTEYLHHSALSIPIYPSLTNEQVEYIITALENAFKNMGK